MRLTAAGAEGVVRALEILENEVTTALGLLGVATTRRPRQVLSARRRRRCATPHVLSAFPLLNLADEGYSGR